MDVNYVDVTQKTGYQIKGAVNSWQTKSGEYNVEHLAGITPNSELIVFWWSRRKDWQAVNVTGKTRYHIVTPVTSWQTPNGPYLVEHLAGIDPNNNLIVFFWSSQHDWQAIDVSAITGIKIISALTSWQTKNGPYNVEHLAGIDVQGNVFVFWWSPQHNWKSVNVTAITGQRIETALTSWQTKNGQYNVEHLAGVAYNNDLITFWWSPQHDWQFVNVTSKTGKKLSSPVASWQTQSGIYNVEHLAGTDDSGDLIISWWSPKHDWQAVVARDSACRKASLHPSNYQILDSSGNAEILNIKGRSNELLHFWWKPATDWQVLDISLITKKRIFAAPESWLTQGSAPGSIVEHVAAESENNHLLVFWYYKHIRELYDSEGIYTTCWKNIGPRNFTCVILSLCIDPNNENLVYAAAQYGGVWRSANGGQTWHPTMDDLPNLFVNAIDLCRSSPNVIYAALEGDKFKFCRSTDFANSWINVADFNGSEPRAIAVHPNDPSIVYVASKNSLHKTINGGQSWIVFDIQIDGRIETNDYGIFDGSIDDVKLDPFSPDTIYIVAKGKGLYKSTDGGSTWFMKGGAFMFEIKDDGAAGTVHPTSLNGSGTSKIAIGEDVGRRKHGSQFIALKVQATVIVSLDGGNSWRQLPGSNLQYNGQLYWNTCIAVSPANENFIVIGGQDIAYTTDANSASPTWHNIGSFHSDQQSIAFCKSNSQNFYFANDGFVGKAENFGASIKNVSEGLVACQGFNVAVSQTRSLVAGTATYHTGILRTGRSEFLQWEYMAGNEGGLFEIDPTNENIMFCNPWAGGDLRKSTDGGSSWNSKFLQAVDDNGSLVNTFIDNLTIRPDDTKKLYAGGFFGHLHYSLDGGNNWDYVKMPDGSPFLPDGDNKRNNRIKEFAFSDSNGQVLYFSCGSNDTRIGHLWVTHNGATTPIGWKQLNIPASATGLITALAVSYLSDNLVLAGFDDENVNNNLWYGIKLANGNYSWVNISGATAQNHLPTAGIFSIVIDPDSAARIFVATSKGVYHTEDAGIIWKPYNQGMPSVIRVFKLQLRKRSRTLYATAYGRGIYRRWIG